MNNRTILLSVLLFTFLTFSNISSRTLWQDEAETALVAKQMAATNTWLPYAADEQGPISQDWSYQFSVSPLWRWHPWLQFYLTAASFKLLGISPLAARLPFAVAGIISFWYFLIFLKKYGPKNTKFQLIAALMFLFSVPLFLHLRQSRYYAPSLLFQLVALDGYLSFNTKKGRIKYLLGSIFLFHSFLPAALTLQLALLLHSLFTNKSLTFVYYFSISLIFTLPWAIWLKIGGQNLNLTPSLIKQHLIQHYIYIHKYIFPAYLTLPLLIKKIRSQYFKNNHLLLFTLIILTNLGLYTINHPYFFRYLIPIIPLFIFIAAWILSQLKAILLIPGLLLIIFTQFKVFPDYVHEITHPYSGTNERLVNWLNSSDQVKQQTVATNYHDFTLRFHTAKTVYGPQHLAAGYAGCPDIVVIYPNWGNEKHLNQIAADCRLKPAGILIPFSKLADSPSPTTHLFKPPTTDTLQVFVAPLSPS